MTLSEKGEEVERGMCCDGCTGVSRCLRYFKGALEFQNARAD